MKQKKNYEKLAQNIIQHVGGEDNITDIFHCMTRLRLIVKDESLLYDDEIRAMGDVMGTSFNAGQYQVIIGNDVDKLYKAATSLLHIEKHEMVSEDMETLGKERNIIEKFTSLVSSIFLPITYPIAGCGLISGIMALCTSQGWITNTSQTYLLLNAIADGIFCFLPFLIAFSASKYFKANAYVAASIVGVLLYPSLTSLLGTEQSVLHVFGGIPIHLMSYSYSIIPIIVLVWMQGHMERFLKKYIPRSLDMIVTPLIVILVMSIVTLAAVGPTMTLLSNLIGDIFTYLFDNMLFVGGLLMGILYPWLVIAGVHLAFVPIQLDMLAKTGITMILPFMAISNTAQAGAAFGVFLRTKNKEFKSVAGSACFSALIGITEPALYGISVRFKKPLYAATLASAVGSLIFVFTRVKATGLALSPLGGLPLFFGETFVPFLIGIMLTFVISAVLTCLFGFNEN